MTVRSPQQTPSRMVTSTSVRISKLSKGQGFADRSHAWAVAILPIEVGATSAIFTSLPDRRTEGYVPGQLG